MKKTKSTRQKTIKACDALHLELLRKERGLKCELCGRKDPKVGRFHILSVGAHPRLRYNSFNILLSCWMPCHYNWHHSYEKAKEIEKKIIKLRGKDYKEKLLTIEAVSKRLTTAELIYIKKAFEVLLKRKK